MNLKQAVLAIMGRDQLKAAIDQLDIEGVDRRSVEAMAATLSRSPRATPALLLGYLSEWEVKAVCSTLDLPSTGRRSALIENLLALDSSQKARPANGRTEPPRKGSTKQYMKERPTMAEKEPDSRTASQDEKPIRLPDPPAGMMRVTKTELVWPGKYNDDGTLKEVPRVSLPFQVIEAVNESRATREVQKRKGFGLFETYAGDEGETFEAGWKNKLIWGDNLVVIGSLLEKFAGKVDLIYIDPPFATGADFSFAAPIGESGEQVFKEQSVIEEKAYRDTWGRGVDSYLSMIYDRLSLLRELLSEKGSIYIHCDYHVGHLIRNVGEEVFGGECFLNEIVWKRSLPHNDPKKYGRIHDTILFFVKSPDKYAFNQLFTPQSEEYIASHYTQKDPDGRIYRLQSLSASGTGPARRFGDRTIAPPPGTHWRFGQDRIDELLAQELIVFTSTGQPNFKRYLDESKGSALQSLWTDVTPLNPQAIERLDYSTQKPEALLERVIQASSSKGDLVADFF